MDTVEQKLANLDQKVDTLYEIMRELNRTLIEVVKQSQPHDSRLGITPHLDPSTESSGFSPPDSSENRLEHKDVLVDDNYLEANSSHREDPSITTDIQIQRLTAQLTAAYNRIAALEERLLSQRAHF